MFCSGNNLTHPRHKIHLTGERKEMNKSLKTILYVSAVTILVSILYASSAAAAPQITTVKTGRVYSVKENNNFYKIKISRDSLLRFIKTDLDVTLIYVNFYKKASFDKAADTYSLSSPRAYINPFGFIFLKKGTYYFEINSGKGSFKISNLGKPPANKANYCRRKAIPLAKNKKVTALQYDKEKYDRWYRITLPKDQYITLYLSDSKLTPRWLYKGLLDQLGIESRFYRGDSKRQFQKEVEMIRLIQHKKAVIILD